MEKFTLQILGSASAKPRLERNSSAQLLQAAGRLFLIDCAEGTQQAIHRQAEIVRSRAVHQQGFKKPKTVGLEAIFISHIHGDHLFGLFPLLSTMAMNGRSKPLKIFGPANLGPVLTFYKSYWGQKDPYELEFVPLKMKRPETALELPGITVEAFPLNHGIDCYGFIFRETGSCPFEPRSFAYCSDTSPFPELSSWVKGVDLLYHEGTYLNEDSSKAASRFHSTVEDAAGCASAADVSRLLLGHYSSGIREEDIAGKYLEQARRIFPCTDAVHDGDIFDVPVKPLLK